MLQMTRNWPTSAIFGAYAESDWDGVERELPEFMSRGSGRMDVIERQLSALNDHRHPFAPTSLQTLDHYLDRWGRPPLIKAQVLRAHGDFEGAAGILGEIGPRPYEARARIELAQSRGLKPDPDNIAVLRKLGDVDYLESHQIGV